VKVIYCTIVLIRRW